MSEAMPDVHPWTLDWYNTLPEAYRTLDKQQKNSRPELWDALTIDPTFYYGWGDWDVKAPVQSVNEVMVSIQQTFRGIAGEPVYCQIFWAAPSIAETLVQVSIVTAAGDLIEEVTVEPIVGGPGNASLALYPDADGRFTVRILILLPAPENNALEVLGINVGTKKIFASDLPVGGFTQPTSRPLLRYMDGPGRVGGGFREKADALWDGKYTNPATVPEESLKWLAQMMGVSARLRTQLAPASLREYMVEVSSQGRKGIGTKTAIAETARAFLIGEQMVEIITDQAHPHTLFILLNPADVPGGDLDWIVAQVRAAGVVPAGHALVARAADTSWDEWAATAGAAWQSVEGSAPTWVRSTSLGIDLEG